MIESQSNNKNVKMMLNVFAILLGIGIVLGVSYAIFRTMDVGKKTNVITTGSFGLEIQNESAEGISVTNALPMTFEEGMKTTPYTFTVVNTGDYDIDYKLGLEAYTDSNMPSKAVRYLLVPGTTEDVASKTEKDTKLVSQAIEQYANDENNESKKVYYIETGVIKAGASQNYVLYMWIDYDATTEITGTKFKVRARADGEAASKKEFRAPTQEELAQMHRSANDQYTIASFADGKDIVYLKNNEVEIASIFVTDSQTGKESMYSFYLNISESIEGMEKIKLNTWYYALQDESGNYSAEPIEYTGSVPFNKADLTTIYCESYLDYLISLF